MRAQLLHATAPKQAFLIRTKTHRPPTYFGAAMDRVGRSGIFAFASHSFALRVAQGLEAHRRVSGDFPSVSTTDGIELSPHDDDLRPLDMLEIDKVEGAQLRRLVGGSGVVVCYMRLDQEEEAIQASILFDTGVKRAWLHALYTRKAVEE